jgi:hypothetical protein
MGGPDPNYDLKKMIVYLLMLMLTIIRPCPRSAPIVGYVYIITHNPFDGAAKIGISKNPQRRLAQLQTGNPARLIIYGMFGHINYKSIERSIHAAYADKLILGEWFRLSRDQMDKIIVDYSS